MHGRAYVIVTRDSAREPRRQVSVSGVPFWGTNISNLGAGGSVTIADGAQLIGYPLDRLRDLPAGEYYVQAFVNVYTTFRRADGKVVRMHQESGDGQNPWISPGNLHSKVVKLRIGSGARTHVLELSEVIPPIEPVPAGGTLQQGNPPDQQLVKFIKIRSEAVSRFWGRDMYIGANILLPRDYHANPQKRYPVLYMQGHFPGRSAPFGFGSTQANRPNTFDPFWLSDRAPDLIVVTIRDANPFYDTSYSVNSANVGPYGDAITRELIPHIERNFRAIAEPWARTLAGGSTGGWEALAMQIFYPDAFGGAWGWCPDPVDFNYHQIVNIYKDANAYTLDRGWLKVERPGNRRPDGNVQYTMRDENRFELAVGTRGRSAGQWAIWEATFGSVAADGYPQAIWDPMTGAIDKKVAAYWKEHFDLTDYLRRNWPVLGPKLQGKLHIAVGDADSYYLEQGVYLLEDFLKTTTSPKSDATFEYGKRKPHCWIGYSRDNPGTDLSQAEFVRILGDYLNTRRPR